MPKSTKSPKSSKVGQKRRRIMMPVSEELADDIKRLSEASGSTPQNVVAGLVWLGKKMFGREVILQSKDESISLKIHAFEDLTKLTNLEDVE